MPGRGVLDWIINAWGDGRVPSTTAAKLARRCALQKHSKFKTMSALLKTELFYNDLAVGQTFTSATHVISSDEIKAFAALYDPQPFHLDDEAAKSTLFGGLAASGWQTAAITMRLIVDSMPIAGGLIGTEGEIAWPTPTRPGDALQVTSEILELTPSRSRADRGSARVRIVTRNQRGQDAQTFIVRIVVPRRGAA